MIDVVEIAKERQARLATEIAKLDDFIRMVEMLVKYHPSKSNKASGTEDEKAAESTVPATVRPYSAAADGKDAEAEREDLSVRELKAGERVDKPCAIHSEPSPDRPRGLGHFKTKPM